MLYRSNKGGGKAVNFEKAILAGYAPDGGLYVPDSLPKINFSLMRDSDPKHEAREAALEKLRVSPFTEIPDPDRWRGIGALATPTVKKLKAADWLKRNQTTYEK